MLHRSGWSSVDLPYFWLWCSTLVQCHWIYLPCLHVSESHWIWKERWWHQVADLLGRVCLPQHNWILFWHLPFLVPSLLASQGNLAVARFFFYPHASNIWKISHFITVCSIGMVLRAHLLERLEHYLHTNHPETVLEAQLETRQSNGRGCKQCCKIAIPRTRHQ